MGFLAYLSGVLFSLGAVTTKEPVTCPALTFLPHRLHEQGPHHGPSLPTLPGCGLCSRVEIESKTELLAGQDLMWWSKRGS